MNKIDKYIFLEIFKGSLFMCFIFLSISWLLQFTRLISLTNLIQVDIFTILYLSIFLIPNLITIIIPFAIMFGLIITFIKLHKDRELISIYTLGRNIKSIRNPLIYFSLIFLFILIIFNFYLSPIIYKNYKVKEYEIRNKINFEKIIISNFIEINTNTFLDFKKNKKNFEDVFIKFNESNVNMIYAKEADISQANGKFYFQLINGFKITLVKNNKIEKLEFDNYLLEIPDKSFREYDNFDNNTFNIFEDFNNKNYVNILYKIIDSFIILVIISFFYFNNVKLYKFNIFNMFTFVSFSSLILVINQILKNSIFNLNLYFIFFIILIFLLISHLIITKKNA